MQSFLMIGQSNMAGRGEFGEVPEIHNRLCYMLRNGRFQPMSEPVNPDRAIFHPTLHSGVCLAASFADALANETSDKVGLIPCADGGTGLALWQPDGVLLENAIGQTLLACRSSEFRGILWHQGENDSTSPALAALYHDRFLAMYRHLCERLGREEIPVLIGGLGDFLEPDRFPAAKTVDAVLRRLAEELPVAAYVSAAGLDSKGDNLHFNSKALREFGLRYYHAWQDLCRQTTKGQTR